jgi:chromosome segregation ATPase
VVEPTDVIMPILQPIQGDIADMRRAQDDHTRRLVEVGQVLSQRTRQLNEMNGYMSFSLSMISRHTGENESVREELDAIKRRLARLEAQIQPA